MALHFKPEVDFNCVSELFNMVRNKELMEKRTEALDHAFYLGGSINAWLGKDKTEPEVFAAMSVPNELEGEDNLLDRIQAQLDEVSPKTDKDDEKSFGAARAPVAKMNPILASLLKKLIQLVLEQLL